MPRGIKRVVGRRAGVPKAGLAKKEKFVEACAESGSAKKAVKPSSAKVLVPLEKLGPHQRAEVFFDAMLQGLRRETLRRAKENEKAKTGSTKSTKPPLAIPKGKKSPADAVLLKLPFNQQAEIFFDAALRGLQRGTLKRSKATKGGTK